MAGQYYISIDAKDSGAYKKIAAAARRGSDFGPIFERMADEIAARNKINFNSNGSMVGGWKPLKPKSIRDKARSGYGNRPPMIRSGKLYRSVTKRPFDIEQIGRTKMVIGTGLKYAAPHFYGAPKINLPSRKYITVSRDLIQKYEPDIKRHIAGTRETARGFLP